MHEGKILFNFHSDNLPGRGAVFLFLQVEMDSLEILPDSNCQIGTIQSHFFPPFQALTQAGVVFEEGAVPSSSAALRGEKVEDLLEHQLVITGALSHLDWGDILSSPRTLEVVSVF